MAREAIGIEKLRGISGRALSSSNITPPIIPSSVPMTNLLTSGSNFITQFFQDSKKAKEINRILSSKGNLLASSVADVAPKQRGLADPLSFAGSAKLQAPGFEIPGKRTDVGKFFRPQAPIAGDPVGIASRKLAAEPVPFPSELVVKGEPRISAAGIGPKDLIGNQLPFKRGGLDFEAKLQTGKGKGLQAPTLDFKGLDLSSKSGLLEAVSRFVQFGGDVQQFNRARGIDPFAGKQRKKAPGVKIGDIQKRIKFIQDRLDSDFPPKGEELVALQEEFNLLTPILQQRLGVSEARKSKAESKAVDIAQIKALIDKQRK